MSLPRLGVNIDHVATLRQQRGESYPEISRASEVCLATGAHQITIHLREDRRHIQDQDLYVVHEVCKKMGKPLNLEMAASGEMTKIAIEQKPDWVCLVPEKREEKTTEGGLDLLHATNFERLQRTCEAIKEASKETKISLFVEAQEEVLHRCLDLPIDAVEIHTGEFARDFLNHRPLAPHLEKFRKGALFIQKAQLGYHAGHGLTLSSVVPLLQEGDFEEYNIGHWIVSESVFLGLGHVIKEMLELFKKYPLKKLSHKGLA